MCGKGGLGLERVRRGSKEGVISRRERLDDDDDDDDDNDDDEDEDEEELDKLISGAFKEKWKR